MFTKTIGAECKSLYTSPLAEEIVVSFEEDLLGSLKFSSTSGAAGADPEYYEYEI